MALISVFLQSASLYFWVMFVLSLVMAIILNYTKFFMYNCQLCPYYNHCGGPQGRQIHNSWVLLTRRSSSTLSECEWIGDLHSRWFVVFACLRANGNCITYTLWKNNGIWTRAKPLNVDTAKKAYTGFTIL
ncbi:unnamed protein product [Lactuca virosa]|uniref:Uncharacterized protein n=1 Tax=Lactuca virosa TaxID=75947 RepID=A0AAU9PGW5_9ASTR|nr:unnamed protein product [Lactuca virosa]